MVIAKVAPNKKRARCLSCNGGLCVGRCRIVRDQPLETRLMPTMLKPLISPHEAIRLADTAAK
jgi:hypothetical protein